MDFQIYDFLLVHNINLRLRTHMKMTDILKIHIQT